MKKEKLKTLKDLEIAGHEVVRQEAIKWIKADVKDLCEILNVEELDDRDLRIIDLVLKTINNITEEDLKDEVKDDL